MKIEQALTLDDIRLVPAAFSEIASRKDVDTSVNFGFYNLKLPLIASNMDSVYSPKLAKELARLGGIACVHRFCSIEENVSLFEQGIHTDNLKPWVSVGIGPTELDRFVALLNAGAEMFVLDVANAANSEVIKAYNKMRELAENYPFINFVVGNFSTSEQIATFIEKTKVPPRIFKIGQGNGSACETTKVTGIGLPTVSTILSCRQILSEGQQLILDGGIKNSGDLAKAIALGVDGVFIGRLFAACEESGAPGWACTDWPDDNFGKIVEKVYRGSASLASYEVQGKVASFRAPEGASYTIPITGTVQDFMHLMSGGLRSSMSYLGAHNIKEFQKNAQFVQVTVNGLKEGQAYGKTDR